MRWRSAALLTFATVCMTAQAACADIQIGTAGPLKGQYANLGEQLRQGTQAAVDDINAAGGINGEKLVLSVEDDNCEPRQAATVAQGFVAKGVRFVAGHYCSTASMAAALVYADANIVMLSPASTYPAFTEEGSWTTNRLAPRDDAQASFAGTAVAKAFAGKTVAILTDGSPFGSALARSFKLALNAGGVTEKLNLAYKPNQNDYEEQVGAILSANVDVIYIGGYAAEAGTFIRRLRDLASPALLVGGDTLLTEQFWQVSGQAGEGAYATLMTDPASLPYAQQAKARLEAAGFKPEGFTLYAYAAVQAYAAAVKATGGTDARAISAWWRAGNKMDTAIGQISLDAKGDITTPAISWYKWSVGKFSLSPGFP